MRAFCARARRAVGAAEEAQGSAAPTDRRRARTSAPYSRCAPRAGAAAAAQIEAGHAQRAGGWRQQAAEHAEGRRLARAVGAEQAEDLAACATVKLTSLTATKAPKRRVRCCTAITASDAAAPMPASRRWRGVRRVRGLRPARDHARLQPGNEAVLEARRCRRHAQIRQRRARASSDRAALAAAVTTRTRLPWITASITPGALRSRACNAPPADARRVA